MDRNLGIPQQVFPKRALLSELGWLVYLGSTWSKTQLKFQPRDGYESCLCRRLSSTPQTRKPLYKMGSMKTYLP